MFDSVFVGLIYIFEPYTNIQWFRRFDLGFWQTSKKFIGNFNMRRNLLESLKICLVFPENGLVVY